MVSKELSEAAVELNAILKYTSSDIVNKIPEKFIKFLKENASTTYKFNYSPDKPLEEQNIKLKTKALIALIYKNYLCDQQEKCEYLNNVSKVLENIEQEKREMYNPDNIFKERVQEKTEEIKSSTLPVHRKKENIFIRIIYYIKRIFERK